MWLKIILVYLFGLAATSPLGMMGPLVSDIQRHFAVNSQGVGIALAGQLLPLAFAGVLMGWLIGRLGPRRLLAIGAVLMAFGALVNAWTAHFALFRGALLLQGLALVALLTAGQSLLMMMTSGRQQVQALTLWSTVAPVGFAVGAVLVSFFAGGERWQSGFLIYGVALMLFSLASLLLPVIRMTPVAGNFRVVLRNGSVLRFGFGLSLASLAGVGTNVIGALYLNQVHGVSPALSAQIMAVASLSGIAGSVVTGMLLARGAAGRTVGALIVAIAVCGGTAFYVPWGVLPVALAGAIAQQVAMGGFIAMTYSLLPRVLPDPSMSGAAVGLVGQITGLGATVAAPLFLAVLAWGQWSYLLSLVVTIWATCLLLLPRARAAVPVTGGPFSLRDDLANQSLPLNNKRTTP
ncbi:nitrate/nitrite transporter [Pseudomonas sp. OIL-1]|uniref:MFS transporter n=1 Tax=Pseudomonas sp. OIL-1 TaxID=2706126 RepID=UPI0013A74DE0|nr:MFS transporter [Pseudomonas sp. OIL-1]QIB51186.1 MFS transporter [Pseudomonas sp. OIL-1]